LNIGTILILPLSASVGDLEREILTQVSSLMNLQTFAGIVKPSVVVKSSNQNKDPLVNIDLNYFKQNIFILYNEHKFYEK
jgi:hypothetical protein